MLRVAQLHENVGGQVLLTQISQLGIFPSCNHKSLLTAEICTPMDESRCFRHLQLSEVKNFLQPLTASPVLNVISSQPQGFLLSA